MTGDILRDALEGIVMQFGFRTVKGEQPAIWTGGMGALEEAFAALGWDEPHILPETCCCEVAGCAEEDTCGTPWGAYYLRLCPKHYASMTRGDTPPPVKPWAKKLEAKAA